MPTLWCDCRAFYKLSGGDVLKDIAGYCESCKHAHFEMGSFGPISDDFTCDMWETEEWKKMEAKLGKMAHEVGGSVECPLWEPKEPERFPEPMSYCERHLLWYGTKYGCPRCEAEELKKEKGGVIL